MAYSETSTATRTATDSTYLLNYETIMAGAGFDMSKTIILLNRTPTCQSNLKFDVGRRNVRLDITPMSVRVIITRIPDQEHNNSIQLITSIIENNPAMSDYCLIEGTYKSYLQKPLVTKFPKCPIVSTCGWTNDRSFQVRPLLLRHNLLPHRRIL
jgi:hypothetical protein